MVAPVQVPPQRPVPGGDQMYINPELIDELKRSKVILFVGAGVSANLGFPSDFRSYGDFLELADYYEIKKGSIGPLRSWMDVSFHDPSIQIKESRIHELIAKFNFHIIYTTNYDRWLERAFEAHGVEYVKVTNTSATV
jgi:NAD-dependent SIR2 family protein deacetylase